MKRTIINGLIIALAISASAFKDTHKSVTNNFLVQTVWGVYTQSYQGEGICLLPSAYPCKYEITALGKIYIPNQLTYSITEINTYISNGWIWDVAYGINKIYFEEIIEW